MLPPQGVCITEAMLRRAELTAKHFDVCELKDSTAQYISSIVGAYLMMEQRCGGICSSGK